MIYVVCYVTGTYGSGLSHFVNCHEGFYSVVPGQPDEGVDSSGGAFEIDKDLNIYIKEKRIPINNLNVAVKTRAKDNPYIHTMIQNYQSYLENKDIKLIIIAPTDEILENAKNRNIWPSEYKKHPSKWYREYIKNIQSYKNIIKEVADTFSYGNEYFIVKMEDILRWTSMPSDEYPDSYLSLCKFLDTNPRPTFKIDLKRIFFRTLKKDF